MDENTIKPMENNKSISIKAILIGWLVDIIGSIIIGLAIGIGIGIIIGFLSATQGGTPSDIQQNLKVITQSPGMLIFQGIIGMLFTMLGGYVTAYIAKQSELKNALIMGILSMIFGLFCSSLSSLISENVGTYSIIYKFLFIILTIPFALLGGYIRILLKKE